ncbi:MAG: molybdopterin-dependent oxidoreductase [Melioribacteraceae bacterium]|nr:molybdopterin-dependent oxidoreductase [Melioribacteraceae bacterium]
MKSYDSIQHVKGASKFVDDLPITEGTLYGYVYYSSIAHGEIIDLDIKEALKSDGVKAVLTADDIPGQNQIGGIIPDEELLADSQVHYIGQPIAFVVAENKIKAHKAAQKISVEYKKLPAVFDARDAFENGMFLSPPRVFTLGSVDDIWAECDFVIEGIAESGAQEHLYLETQGAFALPTESGGVKIYSSTQGPTQVQKICSRVLNIPMNRIEVDVPRLGGGFGGKEDQATPWAVMCALAAHKLKLPVKLILPRQEDLRMTGKRHKYSSDFKIGLSAEGKILAYEVSFYQNGGAAADLSPAILERTLFHCTNSYYIPNVKATAYSCKTNLPPATAFRGFGGPQGMFVIESAINKAAEVMGIDASEIQRKNLLCEGDQFPFGQKTENCHAITCYDLAKSKFQYKEEISKINQFNTQNKFIKKGIYTMPVCFGISFTSTFMNQASALIHVFNDGSISVSTAAVEMGQGVNAKITEMVAREFGVESSRIKIETTNTTRVANTSPTAASKGADLNGFASISASKIIIERLKKVAADELKATSDCISIKNEIVHVSNQPTDITWNKIIQLAFFKRVSLSAQAHHSTPDIYFDKTKEKGKPFAYHVYGSALITAIVDCLRGTCKVESVKVVHDFGESIYPLIDKGQVEGGIVQGIGWMTLEEVVYDESGKLISDALSTYKVPDINFSPEIEIHFLENSPNPYGPFKSKAVGEPPLMYGIGAFFAIRNALKSFSPNREFNFIAPMTNERVLMALYSEE